MLGLSKALRICCFCSWRIKKRLCRQRISKPRRTQPFVSTSAGIKWNLVSASRLLQLVIKILLKFLLLLFLYVTLTSFPNAYMFSKILESYSEKSFLKHLWWLYRYLITLKTTAQRQTWINDLEKHERQEHSKNIIPGTTSIANPL